MQVLITGAGLIGSHVAKALVEDGHEVVLLDTTPNGEYVSSVVRRLVHVRQGSAADFPTVMDAMLAHRVDTVVHTAGLIGALAQAAPWQAVEANVISTANVAEASRMAGVKRVVYASTHGVYDLERCQNEAMHEGSPVTASGMYGACKLSAEHILEAYSRAAKMDVVALRLVNVYGRGHYVAGSTGGEAFNALVEPVVRGQPGMVLPGVKGTGEWVYIKDVVSAVLLALRRAEAPGFQVVGIGTGHLSSHEDVMAAVAAVIPEATFREQESSMPPLKRRYQPYDISYAKEALGFSPAYDLRRGVADYIAEVRDFLRWSNSTSKFPRSSG